MGKYRESEIVRASAALPAAGAYGVTDPIYCLEFDNWTLVLDYQRGLGGGAVTFYVEYRFEDTGEWYRSTIYDGGAVAANADTASTIQRETFAYGATGAARESVIFGPHSIVQFAKHIRFGFAESGQVGSPGTCRAQLVLTRNKQKM